MREIGGYFSLELNKDIALSFHKEGLFLNTGRNALEYVLSSIPEIKKLWIPYFTCDVVLEPLAKLKIPYEYYSINRDLEIDKQIELSNHEFLLYTNYFGIKDLYIDSLLSKYASNLIIDNAQALYAYPTAYSFYSPRKFVGLPDGGIAYSISQKVKKPDVDRSFERCSHLLKRYDLGASAGYADFKENNSKLSNMPVLQMSNLTNALFENINFSDVKRRRIANFSYLHSKMKDINGIRIPECFQCPMVYPLYIEDDSLRKKLISSGVFVATYWPNVLEYCDEHTLEYQLAKYILPLPIDQRYDEYDMETIYTIINER